MNRPGGFIEVVSAGVIPERVVDVGAAALIVYDRVSEARDFGSHEAPYKGDPELGAALMAYFLPDDISPKPDQMGRQTVCRIGKYVVAPMWQRHLGLRGMPLDPGHLGALPKVIMGTPPDLAQRVDQYVHQYEQLMA